VAVPAGWETAGPDLAASVLTPGLVSGAGRTGLGLGISEEVDWAGTPGLLESAWGDGRVPALAESVGACGAGAVSGFEG